MTLLHDPAARAGGARPAPGPSREGWWRAEVATIEVFFGPGRASCWEDLVGDFAPGPVLLVTDPGLAAAGHAGAVRAGLETAGLEVLVFDRVEENPTTRLVEDAAASLPGRDLRGIVAVGGGSSLDAAKGVNFLLTNDGRMEDYWGFGKAIRPMLPSIGVPTTAGTGSEAQSFALLSHADSGRKLACGDLKARFRKVVLDPELTASTPRGVAALAGLDALSHALESWVTTRRTPVSALFAAEAWKLLDASYEESLGDDPPLPVRERMLLGSHWAGAAIEASMLGAAHAGANPLTARFGVAHGAAVGLMLPHVIRYNAPAADTLYRQLHPGGAQALASRIEALRHNARLPERLRDAGVAWSDLPELARLAAAEWTGRFNPRPVEADDFRELYEAAF